MCIPSLSLLIAKSNFTSFSLFSLSKAAKFSLLFVLVEVITKELTLKFSFNALLNHLTTSSFISLKCLLFSQKTINFNFLLSGKCFFIIDSTLLSFSHFLLYILSSSIYLFLSSNDIFNFFINLSFLSISLSKSYIAET